MVCVYIALTDSLPSLVVSLPIAMNPPEPLTIALPAEAAEAGTSQAVKAQLRLREMILAGELPGGARIAELTLVEKLGVSRTPISLSLIHI